MRSCLNATILFCVILSLFHGASSISITSATNGNVTLRLGREGQISEILWKYKGTKMVEWDGAAADPTEYLTFKGRTELDIRTGDVTIVKLTKHDSGDYEAEVAIQGKLIIISHRVVVIDPVTGAKVTCQRSNATMATLHCEAEGESLSYRWSGPGLQTEMRGQTGPQITKEKDQNSTVYTCVVDNPVSNSSVAYHSSDCFASDAGNLQLIIGVACSAVIVVAAAAAAGFGYHCYKKSIGRKDAGNESKHETRENEKGPNQEENDEVQPSNSAGQKDVGGENKSSEDEKIASPKAEEKEQNSDSTGQKGGDGGDTEGKIGDENAAESKRGQKGDGDENEHETRGDQKIPNPKADHREQTSYLTGQKGAGDENEHETRGDQKKTNLKAKEKEKNSDTTGQKNGDGGDTEGKKGDENAAENRGASPGDVKRVTQMFEEHSEVKQTHPAQSNTTKPQTSHHFNPPAGQKYAGDEYKHETRGDQKIPNLKAEDTQQTSYLKGQNNRDEGDTAENTRGAAPVDVKRVTQMFEEHSEVKQTHPAQSNTTKPQTSHHFNPPIGQKDTGNEKKYETKEEDEGAPLLPHKDGDGAQRIISRRGENVDKVGKTIRSSSVPGHKKGHAKELMQLFQPEGTS